MSVIFLGCLLYNMQITCY